MGELAMRTAIIALIFMFGSPVGAVAE